MFRTFGKTYINIIFFYPGFKQKTNLLRRRNKTKQTYFYKDTITKPVNKHKKHLTIFLFFFQLEKILKTQVLFKFKNICTSLVNTHLSSSLMMRLFHYFLNKFSQFKFQFKDEIYTNTIMFVLNLFKFKKPDSILFANYIASVLPLLQKHTQFLIFLKRILHVLQKIFQFSGVKILLAGKLNGFSRAQLKQIQVGCVPCQSTSTPYVFGYSHAFTNAGKLGVKI